MLKKHPRVVLESQYALNQTTVDGIKSAPSLPLRVGHEHRMHAAAAHQRHLRRRARGAGARGGGRRDGGLPDPPRGEAVRAVAG